MATSRSSTPFIVLQFYKCKTSNILKRIVVHIQCYSIHVRPFKQHFIRKLLEIPSLAKITRILFKIPGLLVTSSANILELPGCMP